MNRRTFFKAAVAALLAPAAAKAVAVVPAATTGCAFLTDLGVEPSGLTLLPDTDAGWWRGGIVSGIEMRALQVSDIEELAAELDRWPTQPRTVFLPAGYRP